jgi:hypothetical protein
MADPMPIRVRKWLENTIEKSERAVDHGWQVEVDPKDETFMVIDSPKMPFKIIVSVEKEISYIAFITGLKLAGQASDVLTNVFRDLLYQNKSMNLSKFCLMEPDDTLILRTDLYTNYMNKKEFSIALEAVIMGGRWLIAQLGQSEDENIKAKEMSSLGSAELLKGTPKDEVVAKMIKAGYEEDKAKALVDRLAVTLGLEEAPDGTKIEPAEAKDPTENPVDRYIW